MTGSMMTLVEWTLVDGIVLGIAVQQYISISRDLKRTKEKEAAAQAEKDRLF